MTPIKGSVKNCTKGGLRDKVFPEENLSTTTISCNLVIVTHDEKMDR